MIRVLQVVAALTAGGVETLLHSYYEEMDRERFHFDVACYSYADGVYRGKFEELGCEIYALPSKKKPLKSVKALYRVLKDGKYDIVHVHQDDLSFLPILVARLAGVKVRIVHSHLGKYPHSFAGKAITAVTNPLMFRLANGYFACSEKAKREFYPARLQDRVFIMQNGIRSQLFRFSREDREQIRKEYGFTDGQVVIGNVARINGQKNPLFLLEIFRQLHAENENWRLMLVGDGVLRDAVQAKIEELGLQNAAVLTGARDDAFRYYSALDFFVLPSLFEGLGISFVEAQTNGLPTFASMAVPQEAAISSLIEFLPLEEGPEGWVRRIRASAGRPENPDVDDRYDISRYVRSLENEYARYAGGIIPEGAQQ